MQSSSLLLISVFLTQGTAIYVTPSSATAQCDSQPVNDAISFLQKTVSANLKRKDSELSQVAPQESSPASARGDVAGKAAVASSAAADKHKVRELISRGRQGRTYHTNAKSVRHPIGFIDTSAEVVQAHGRVLPSGLPNDIDAPGGPRHCCCYRTKSTTKKKEKCEADRDATYHTYTGGIWPTTFTKFQAQKFTWRTRDGRSLSQEFGLCCKNKDQACDDGFFPKYSDALTIIKTKGGSEVGRYDNCDSGFCKWECEDVAWARRKQEAADAKRKQRREEELQRDFSDKRRNRDADNQRTQQWTSGHLMGPGPTQERQ